MENEDIKLLIRQEIRASGSDSQYRVARVPFHRHNGSDSSRVSFNDLTDRSAIVVYTLFGTQSATAGNYSTFFTAPFAMTVSKITEVHTVLGTDGGTVSLDVEKLIGTTAPGSGTLVTASPFNLKGTINTVLYAPLSTSVGVIQLASSDRLALKLTGTPTSVANVTVTLLLNF